MGSPVVMPMVVVACVVAFLWQMTVGVQESVMHFGLIPQELFAGRTLPLFAHMFLHGGWAHLFGNMYFLWVFGDNVEDRLGRARFVVLYLLSGLAAGLAHAFLESDPTLPVVGASGAISGVMAAYAVLFPRTRLISLILFWRVRWRTSIYLGAWLAIQVFGAAMHQPGIAWWAHIGGFIIGGAIAWQMRPTPMQVQTSLQPRSGST
jgi:membrane associated rhomboid family serine protease